VRPVHPVQVALKSGLGAGSGLVHEGLAVLLGGRCEARERKGGLELDGGLAVMYTDRKHSDSDLVRQRGKRAVNYASPSRDAI